MINFTLTTLYETKNVLIHSTEWAGTFFVILGEIISVNVEEAHAAFTLVPSAEQNRRTKGPSGAGA
ncbi:hypothetical protein KP014_00690 [Paenibacillus sophorae]|uniref:Uncharacterized protein n=1 Tax=Paenibacillus sophorae TaxID=1333845 RepID=A0ABX8HJF7_9BACL|nr:hypothetical protein [Paenibacillus sophorae]QWU18570.1 hypothetical protein KP014_00690 [Paenibacillus sophorae]